MAAVPINTPATATKAVTTSYDADPYQIKGANYIEVWLDDPLVSFTVQFQIAGFTAVERAVSAGGSFAYNTAQSSRPWLVNVKSASAANMQLLIG